MPVAAAGRGVRAQAEQALHERLAASSHTRHAHMQTATAHVASLLTKIGARNRVEIAMWAYDIGRVGP